VILNLFNYFFSVQQQQLASCSTLSDCKMSAFFANVCGGHAFVQHHATHKHTNNHKNKNIRGTEEENFVN